MTSPAEAATLLTVLARGPWKVEGRALHPAEVEAYYCAIRDGAPAPWAALGAHAGSRRCDRANGLLRRAGLICFDPVARYWKPSPAGEEGQP